MPKLFFSLQTKYLRTILSRCLLLSLLLFSFSSCTDQGCIEADDFGEYEQQVLTINANALGDSCEYRPDAPLTDATQGSGLKTCFTAGDVKITDEDDIEQDNNPDKGCEGFANETYKRICVEDCRQRCISNSSSQSTTAEPDWFSTSKKRVGQNVGLTLTPGSEISIRAVGSVVLGGDLVDPLYANATSYGLQSRKNNFSGSFYDLVTGATKNVKFSGKWSNGTGTTYGGDINGNTVEQQAAFNASRRLVLFAIPHPEGYSFDKSANTEIAGIKGTPLFADTRLWKCNYSGADTNNCYSLPYDSLNSFPSTNDVTAQTLYSISTAATPPLHLGTVGGMIRWTDDFLQAESDDPFIGITCNPNCNSTPDSRLGAFIGDLSSNAIAITNNESYAYKISFKNLGSGANSSNCNATLSYSIKNGSVDIVTGAPLPTFTVGSNNWATSYLALERGDVLTISQNNASFQGVNCGNVIAYRKQKLQDIEINKSGLVSFTRLGKSGASGNCNIVGRIINPTGDRRDSPSNDYDNDFYEYDSFGVAVPTDPLANLTVPITAGPDSETPFNKSWSEKVFVRKGQVIRFDPTSWDGTWTVGAVGGLTRKCGVGTVMKVGGIDYDTGQVDDRPAFLCRGNVIDSTPNPDCIVGPGGTCQAYSASCGYNSTGSAPLDATAFCPIEECQVNPFPSSNTACTSMSEAPCETCAARKLAASQESPNLSMSLDQCYDLENYKGKVSNISATTGLPSLTDDAIAKGAKKLKAFDGTYGNFENLTNTADTDAGNKVYRLTSPIYVSVNSRLFFMTIDNNSFLNLANPSTGPYLNNSGGGSYNGNNGYKIDLSGKQEFKNGQWLEARLCREEIGYTNSACATASIPNHVDTEPYVVQINDPTITGQAPALISFYNFNAYGDLIRFVNPNGAGVTPNAGLAQTVNGDRFYRHGYDGTSSLPNADNSDATKEARIGNLRLSFKIKDSEVPNCNMASPAFTTNGVPNCTISDSDSGNDTCNGIIADNPFFSPNTPPGITPAVTGNNNDICGAGTTIGPESDKCKKQFFCANLYFNNSGQYQVIVKVKNNNSNISNIVDSVVSPVIEIMDGKPDGSVVGQAERVYTSIVSDARFQAIVQIMVILMITFYGVGYLMGVSEFSQAEIITRIIKIGVIYLFISPTGWVWFDRIFVSFFKDSTDYVTFLMASAFDKSTELQNAIDNNQFYDKSILFGGIDKVFGMFFSSAVQKKISALLFASIFGPVYLYIIYLSFFLYVFAVANAVLLYLTAQIFISILFVVGPIFFIMLLFGQTKDMFDRWLSELIGFSLQQIFLLTTLSFFSMMMYEVVKMSLGYRVCWDDVWVINTYIARIKLLSFWTIASMPPKMSLQSEVGNIGNPEGIPSLFSILFIWVIASLMNKFIGFMTDLGASIGGSMQASVLGAGLKDAANASYSAAKKMYGNKIGGAAGKAVGRVDKFFFGDVSEKARKDRAEGVKKDSSNLGQMEKAGNKAIDEYKRKNAVELAGKSQEEQNKALQNARNAAMDKKGIELGLGAEDIKRLKEQKTGIGNSTTIGEAAWTLLKTRRSGKEGVGKKNVNTALSVDQFKDSYSSASDEDKVKLAKAADENKLRLNVTRMDQAKLKMEGAAGSALNAITDPKQAFRNAKSAIANSPRSAIDAAKRTKTAIANAPSAAWSATKKAPGAALNKAYKMSGGEDRSLRKSVREKLEKEREIDTMSSRTQWARDAGQSKIIDGVTSAIKDEQRIKRNENATMSSRSADFVKSYTGINEIRAEEAVKAAEEALVSQRKEDAETTMDKKGGLKGSDLKDVPDFEFPEPKD